MRIAYEEELKNKPAVKPTNEIVDTALQLFLKELRRYPLLEVEEERFYARRYREGDMSAKEKLINSNLRLVVSVAKRYTGRGMPFEDLISGGYEGLIKAIERFQLERGNKLSTYAVWWINQGMQRELNKYSPIRKPEYIRIEYNKIINANRRISNELFREPTLDELAKEIPELSKERIADLLKYYTRPLSLEDKIGGGNGRDTNSRELSESIANNLSTPEDELEDSYNKAYVHKLMERSKLNKKEKMVIRLRWGIGNYPHILEEIGGIIGVTRERVRQIQIKAERKIKTSVKGNLKQESR